MMDLLMPNETTANALSPLTWRGVLITLITVPLSLITIFGNILVLISFQMNPLLRTVNNYFLLSLAVADLILGTISMNLYTTYILIGHWTLGDLSCDIWLVVDYVASNASVMNLLAISFDRYLSVTRPLTYRVRRTPRRAAVMITLAWGISVVLWAPAILLWQYIVGERTVLEGQCYVQFLSEPVITFGTAIAAFYLPVSVMAVLYWRVYRETERRSRQLADLRGSKGEETRVSSQSSSQQHSLSSSRNMSGFGETQTQTNTPHLSGGRRRRFCPTITHCTAVWWKRRHRDTKSSTQPAVNPEEASSICGVNKKNDENALNKVVHIPLVPVNKGSKTENGNKVEHSSSIEMCLSESQLYFNQKENPFCSSSVSPTHPPANAVTNARKNRRTWTSSLIREKKAARTLSAILLAFIVTWTPYNIMVLVSTFCDDCIPERLWQLGYWLCYVNSTVNPICYALCNRHFRVTFKALLLCSWRGRSHRKWAQPRGRQVN